MKLECARTPLVGKAVGFLGGRDVILGICPGIGAEGFRIEDGGDGRARIVGNDENGLLYGVGKHRREPGWRGTSVPEKPVRTIYFATHFHNFYHDAPIADVCRYIEELALWGCNTLTVWFDMHHYTGLDDPAAQAMVERLRAMLRAAEGVGMRPGLMLLANEAYSTSPAELRADWTAGHDGYFAPPGGHYHVEICPNQPGGLELILRWRGEMLDAFADVNLGFLVIWPYDQGGCTCAKCAPWGANGFLTVAEPLARLLRQRYPAAKLVLSTWYFDRFTTGEWEGLSQAFAAGAPDWVDYLLADDCQGFPEYPLAHGFPGNLPAVNFPEISMHGMSPWGGFGANPRPRHWQDYWQTVGNRLAGGFPYSEGIFEDFNKVLHLQLNWDGGRGTRDIAREYAAAEFSPAVADAVVEALFALEAGMAHGLDRRGIETVMADGGWDGFADPLPRIYVLPAAGDPARVWQTMQRVDAQLPPVRRAAWRWRVLYLRAQLDDALRHSEGRPTAESDRCFEELARIYHADRAELHVSPVGRHALARLFGKPKR